MADIALGRRVGNIIRIALNIKEAVRNVKQNKKGCRDIERCVARVASIIGCLDQTLERYDEVSPAAIHKDNNMSIQIHDALEDLAKSLEGALHLVTKCQRRHFVLCCLGAGDMAKELRLVQDDIVRKLTLGSFAISVLQLGITLPIAQPAPPPPRRPDRYKKDETTLAGACGAPSDLSYTSLMRVEDSHTYGYYSPQSSGPTFEEPEQLEEGLVQSNLSDLEKFIGLNRFNLSELEVATHNFSDKNLIGRGVSAKVFKGVLRNGLVVALKNFNMFYGDNYGLRREIEIGGMLEHRNVVKTLGYCIDDKAVPVCHFGREIEAIEQCRILVTGYLPNESLRNITREVQRVSWPFCYRIIQGIAQGLHYVHEQNVVHLDLKPDNIIFDSDMNPVIIDFGISVVVNNRFKFVTAVNRGGTVGYMAPECIDNGVVSSKCDVFAFGVILLRTIFQACAKLGFKDYYYHLYEDSKRDAVLQEDMHKMKELFDPTLVEESQLTDVARCLKVGLQCIEFKAANRPTMVEVVDMLNGGRERVAC